MSLKLVTIKSNQQCLSFLERASGNGALDIEQGKNPLLKPWFEKIGALVTPFQEAMVAQLRTHAKRAEEIAKRNKVVAVMKYTVRDFRSGLVRRVRRNGEPEIVLQYYRMPHERKPVYDDDWYQLGQWLLDGEVKALSKGFPAMSNPSADELAASLTAFAELRGNAEEADRRYRDAQDVLVDLRRETQLAARGLAANFRVVLHDKDAPTVRRIMRSYGFQFRGQLEETPEPEMEEVTQNQDTSSDDDVLPEAAVIEELLEHEGRGPAETSAPSSPPPRSQADRQPTGDDEAGRLKPGVSDRRLPWGRIPFSGAPPASGSGEKKPVFACAMMVKNPASSPRSGAG
ncbi:MAG: hypothetical protein QNK37_37915 [Acidobacteriota bacterium]|nr:hypothetical protein [Acidobacteriota bacterium]